MKYSEAVEFCSNAYRILNGEVNTLIPSLSFTIDKHTDSSSTVAGNSVLCITNIFISDILETLNKLSKTDDEIKGVLLYTLIHELSHNDQNINLLRMASDDTYRTIIEAENEVRTITYIRNNLEKLRSDFGNFFIPTYLFNNFNREIDKLIQIGYIRSIQELRFKQCKSLQSKILSTIDAVFASNIEYYYLNDNRIHNLGIKLLDINRNPIESYNIIVEDMFYLGKRDLSRLSIRLSNIELNSICTSYSYSTNRLDLLVMCSKGYIPMIKVCN